MAPIAYRQFTGVAPCPTLGPVPACYVVLTGYAAVALSMVIPERWRTMTFTLGMLPVFGLAMTGSILEVMGNETCPRNAAMIPTCYFSLALSLIVIGAFLANRIFRSSSQK